MTFERRSRDLVFVPEKVLPHSEDRSSLLFSLLGWQAGWPGLSEDLLTHVGRSDSRENVRHSLLLPCKFPGRLRIVSVHEGLVLDFFSRENFACKIPCAGNSDEFGWGQNRRIRSAQPLQPGLEISERH